MRRRSSATFLFWSRQAVSTPASTAAQASQHSTAQQSQRSSSTAKHSTQTASAAQPAQTAQHSTAQHSKPTDSTTKQNQQPNKAQPSQLSSDQHNSGGGSLPELEAVRVSPQHVFFGLFFFQGDGRDLAGAPHSLCPACHDPTKLHDVPFPTIAYWCLFAIGKGVRIPIEK